MTTDQTYMSHLQELCELTASIRAATVAGDWDDLLASLGQRQELMNRIDALSEAERILSEEDQVQVLRILEAVAASDAEMAGELERSLGETRADLQAADASRTSISAYERTNRPGPQMMPARFVDKQQ